MCPGIANDKRVVESKQNHWVSQQNIYGYSVLNVTNQYDYRTGRENNTGHDPGSTGTVQPSDENAESEKKKKKKKTQGSLSLRAVDGQPPTAFATPR